MNIKDDENCKNWYVDFIEEFRQRYNKFPESARSFVWNIDNFNSPCQIISFVVHANKDLTYLWVRKDPEIQDLDVKCYGRINPQNFLETAELILSDKLLYAKMVENKENTWPHESYGAYLENHLVFLSKFILKQDLIGIEFPIDHVVGTKFSTPMNGFFWMIYDDIKKINPERILKEIFEGALAREKTDQNAPKRMESSKTNKEELVFGNSTYFYPPIWVGEKPAFDFKSKVNGLFIFPIPTYVMEYKNYTLIFNQKGRFFLGINDRGKCIRYMNEIIGTAILQGYNIDIVTDLDIGESTVTKDKGETRSQTYSRSIARYWQFEQEMNPITEEMIASYIQIKEEDLRNIVRFAESASMNTETSDYIVFFAHASNYVRDGKYKESFLFDWFVIERYLLNKWDLYIGVNSLEENKKKNLKYWDINNVIEVLYLTGKIDQKIYQGISTLKKIRNGLYHKGTEVSKKDAIKCHEISELLIRIETNIIISEEN